MCRLEFQYDSNNSLEQKYVNKLVTIASKSDAMKLNYKKSYHTNINELSYNNKDIVLDTWKKILPNDEDNDSSSLSSTELSDYEYELHTDSSDSDSESEVELII